jgi:hypothetical protein
MAESKMEGSRSPLTTVMVEEPRSKTCMQTALCFAFLAFSLVAIGGYFGYVHLRESSASAITFEGTLMGGELVASGSKIGNVYDISWKYKYIPVAINGSLPSVVPGLPVGYTCRLDDGNTFGNKGRAAARIDRHTPGSRKTLVTYRSSHGRCFNNTTSSNDFQLAVFLFIFTIYCGLCGLNCLSCLQCAAFMKALKEYTPTGSDDVEAGINLETLDAGLK